jgi:hypothetical protein
MEDLLPCPPNVFFSTLLYSAGLCSALLYCSVLNHTVLYLTLLYSAPLYSAVLCSTLLYSTPLYSALLCSAVLCSTLLYGTLLYSTLLYSPLLCNTVLYILQHQVPDIQALSCFNCMLLVQWEINLLVGVSGSAGYHMYHHILYILLSTFFGHPDIMCTSICAQIYTVQLYVDFVDLFFLCT